MSTLDINTFANPVNFLNWLEELDGTVEYDLMNPSENPFAMWAKKCGLPTAEAHLDFISCPVSGVIVLEYAKVPWLRTYYDALDKKLPAYHEEPDDVVMIQKAPLAVYLRVFCQTFGSN